jgi:hypothetical protein
MYPRPTNSPVDLDRLKAALDVGDAAWDRALANACFALRDAPTPGNGPGQRPAVDPRRFDDAFQGQRPRLVAGEPHAAEIEDCADKTTSSKSPCRGRTGPPGSPVARWQPAQPRASGDRRPTRADYPGQRGRVSRVGGRKG